jgi:hypothetical protein
MIVDAESLLVPIQRAQFSQERQILLWVLVPSVTERYHKECTAHLLRVLRNHQDQLEVVHPERDVIQPIHVGKEDDELDRVLDDVGVLGWLCQHESSADGVSG